VEQDAIRRKRKLIILCCVLVLSVGLTAVFAVSLALEIRTQQSGQTFYGSLPVAYKPRPAQNAPGGGISVDVPVGFTEAHVPFIDFASTRESFPDIIGWIQSYNTVINYPVVHGSDNDFYLSHLPDQSKNKMGSIFLDYRNQADFSEKNILIYGHNMGSGDLFGSLKNYSNQSYFEQHDSMYLFTPSADYELLLFAGYVLDSAQEVPPMSFRDAADFEQYKSDIRSRSVFKSDTDIQYGDQLIFLCTCTPGGSKDERLILVCKTVMK